MQRAPEPASVTLTSAMTYVTAGLVGAGGLLAIDAVATGASDIEDWFLLGVLPCVVGMAYGARRLRRRRGRGVLVAAAMTTGLVLVVTSVVGLAANTGSAFVVFAAWPLLLVPLSVVTAALARSRAIADWLATSRYAAIPPATS